MASYPRYTIILSIDKFFAAIKNGGWHSIDELSDKLGISTSKLEKLSKFLSERGLITYQEKNRRIKIQPLWRLLLPEEQPNDPKAIVTTFMIPPQASIDVQSTHISNISNVELAVSVRIDNKIRDVTIAV
jgi:biotin operon repressor